MNHASFPLDLKSLSDAGQITGLAAGYGNLDAHGDVFAPGAFAKAIAAAQAGGREPAMLLHHDPQRPAGRWDVFAEGKSGMTVSGQIAMAARDGQEAYALLKAGALTGLSVGFSTVTSKAGPGGARIITEAELFEISLVSTPSNPLTRVSGVKAVGDVRELEDLLRSAGMSSRKAKAAASAAWRAAHDEPETSEMERRMAAALMTANANFPTFNRS